MLSLKLNFVRFHEIESEIELPQQFCKKKRNSSAPYLAICTQIASLIFLMTYILYINFCPIPFTRNRDQRIQKISEKVKIQRHLLSDPHQQLIGTNLHLVNIKYKIS